MPRQFRSAHRSHSGFDADGGWEITRAASGIFLRDVQGNGGLSWIGASRALHITPWLFIAFCREAVVGDDELEELLGPNVEGLADMCAQCNFTIRRLFCQVQEEIPTLDSVGFQIWSCKVVNLIHALNLQTQPSLAHRKERPGRRIVRKKCINTSEAPFLSEAELLTLQAEQEKPPSSLADHANPIRRLAARAGLCTARLTAPGPACCA